ncbi:MAG: FkbM family methyltransferase [Gammaproteobacteria bacterium]|nr:FkbM family methyltransferase [Gammaproteobacteria bacterium]
MTDNFISYAQNFEDVMLWRALKSVAAGFYVDVGAAWPRHHSVTAAFYDKGWRGINIEPNPSFYAMLCAERKRDINLNILVGGVEDNDVEFFVIEGTGLSTINKDIAETHRGDGFGSERLSVQQKTLAKVLSEHCEGQEIHFLKVDAEGAEAAVLMSNDWKKFRPWICVIEATLPLSSEESHEEWDKHLVSNGYFHVYSDGLNRFYIRQESQALADFFKLPPNVFDSYETYKTVKLKERVHQLERKLLASRSPLWGFSALRIAASEWWKSAKSLWRGR